MIPGTNVNADFLTQLAAQFGQESQPLTVTRVLITLGLTFCLALWIFLVYKITFKGVLYTRSYNVGLVMTALVTALIIMPISSNITLSLGMVGALSIVRFRTAIKDPMDIVFMFWAIAIGVANGAGFFMVSVTGSLTIGLLLFLMNLMSFKTHEPYLLILHYGPEAEEALHKALPKKYTVKSKTYSAAGVELTIELRIKDKETQFIHELQKIEEVHDAALVRYNGDYVS
jgi:hypothetical protein